MEFRPITRTPGAFQQSVTAEEIEAICRRVFGPNTKVASATELGTGMYNTTYRATVVGQNREVVVRIAPAADRQFTSERALMRNKYASLPYLAALAPLLPRVVAADFTHEVIGRDYMVQSFLDGVPASEHLRTYPRSAWPVSTGSSARWHGASTMSAALPSAPAPARHTEVEARRSPPPWRTSPQTWRASASTRPMSARSSRRHATTRPSSTRSPSPGCSLGIYGSPTHSLITMPRSP